MKLRWYRLLLWKAYFDKGRGLFNYLEKILFLVGLHNVITDFNYLLIIMCALVYAALCLVTGRWWYEYLQETENEIQNRFNPFQKEMREKLIKK